MAKQVTIRDVATHAGVSVATVSKSLCNKKDISEATRQRVLAVCKELGYKPNPLVSALMKTRRKGSTPTEVITLAFVTAFPTPDGWKQHPAPIFRQMYRGGVERADQLNYRLEHFWLYQDNMSHKRFGDVLYARGIPGILFAPIPSAHSSVVLPWKNFSVMVLGLHPLFKQFHRVTTDYYQSMQLALNECFRLGYRRPGLAVRMETIERLEYRWEAAYLLGVKTSGIKSPPEPLIVEEWDHDVVINWIQKESPDVVIGPVIGKLESIIRESGRRIPDDIGMIGLLVGEKGDRLSGIFQDGETIGRVAVDLLTGMIERNETGVPDHPITHTMLGHWNQGITL